LVPVAVISQNSNPFLFSTTRKELPKDSMLQKYFNSFQINQSIKLKTNVFLDAPTHPLSQKQPTELEPQTGFTAPSIDTIKQKNSNKIINNTMLECIHARFFEKK